MFLHLSDRSSGVLPGLRFHSDVEFQQKVFTYANECAIQISRDPVQLRRQTACSILGPASGGRLHILANPGLRARRQLLQTPQGVTAVEIGTVQ